jgi:signal transduction histidine kinase
MNGPDALTGERRGGRSALPSAGVGTPGAGAPSANGTGSRPDPTAAAGRAVGSPGNAPRAGATARPARLSISNWPVAARLVAVFVIASITGLIFGGLRVADAVSTSQSYGRTAQLAVLGQQATVLAQALEDERDQYAGVAAYGLLTADAQANLQVGKADKAVVGALAKPLAAANKKLSDAKAITNAAAARTELLAAAIGPSFPASVQSKATAVITMIDSIPGLRSQLSGQSAASVINNYSSSIANLFTLNDQITSGSGDALLANEVLALGSLSRAKDEASQQRAFLYDALIELSVNDAGTASAPANNVGVSHALDDAGGLGALLTAQGLQFADVTDFTNAATPAQSNAYVLAVAGPQADTAQLIEGFVILNGDPRMTYGPIGKQTTLGYKQAAVAPTWYADQSAVVSEMRQIESQVTSAVVARSQSVQHNAENSAWLTGAITAAAVLLVLLATALVGRSLVNPLRRLQEDALEIATVRLPARVAAAAAGNEVAEDPIEPIGVQSTDEIGRVARAFDQVHAEAVRLAGNEAQLRGSFSAMFISLSRRSVPLIDRLARMIDGMEQNEDDPDQLANLFSMDHLVTRMRRNSENLLVLAGEEPVRKWTESVPLSDVVRAAAAEIEQYGRVTLTVQPGVTVSGQAAADVVHLLAELIENSTLFSPRNTLVRVTVTELSTGGVLVEVRDDGVGVSAARLTDMNWRLDNPPALDVSVSRHMGLYAVAHLAARHGIRVKLRPGVPQGLSALVWLPSSLARQERVPAGSGHSRSFSAVGNGAAASSRPPVLSRQETGRHRGDLISERGEQPVLPERQGQPALPGRPGQAGRPATVWFTAKRPSTGAVRSTAEVAASWRPGGYDPGRPGRHQAQPAAGVAEYAAQTSTGLPRRVPRSSSYPAEAGMSAAAAGTGAGGLGTPLLGAPPGRTPAPPPTPYQQSSPGAPPRSADEGRAPAGRRSPEAMRDRLSGFQLGSRDGVHPGPAPRPAPPAREENSQ